MPFLSPRVPRVALWSCCPVAIQSLTTLTLKTRVIQGANLDERRQQCAEFSSQGNPPIDIKKLEPYAPSPGHREACCCMTVERDDDGRPWCIPGCIAWEGTWWVYRPSSSLVGMQALLLFLVISLVNLPDYQPGIISLLSTRYNLLLSPGYISCYQHRWVYLLLSAGLMPGLSAGLICPLLSAG